MAGSDARHRGSLIGSAVPRLAAVLSAVLLIGTACGTAPSTSIAAPSVTAGAAGPPPPPATPTPTATPTAAAPTGATPSPPAAATDATLNDAWFVDADHGWAVGRRRCPTGPPSTAVPAPACQGVVDHTADGGRTWREHSLGDPRLIPVAIRFVDADHGWLAATTDVSCGPGPCATVMYATDDAGRHWEANFHTGPNTPSMMVNGHPVMARSVSLTTLAMTSARAGWAFGTACAGADRTSCRPVLYATSDGITWGQLALPPLPSSTRASLAHPTAADGWIALSPGDPGASRIIATHDGGRTWQDLPDPAKGDPWQEVSFRSATEGWLLSGSEPGAGQQSKALYHTTDGGRTWQRLAGPASNPSPGQPVSGLPSSGYVGQLVFPTGSDGWIASPRGGLLHSADGGRSWSRVPNVSCGDLTCQTVGFAGPAVGWVVSSRGLWLTTDGGRGWRPLAVPGVDAAG